MKRILKVFLIVIVVLVIALISIPILFKKPLLREVQTTMNKELNASITIDNFQISLWKDFPQVQLKLSGLKIIGVDDFSKDTLASIKTVSTDISLSDLFHYSDLTIDGLTFDNVRLRLITNQAGQSNWDIAQKTSKEPTPIEQSKPDDSSEFKLKLNQFIVNNLSLHYTDIPTGTELSMGNTNLQASGKLKGSASDIELNAETSQFSLNYDSVSYVKQMNLKLSSTLSADYDKMSFKLGKTTLYINRLPLDIDGEFSMPSDSIYMNFKFHQPGSDFKSLLALVPEDYQSYLKQTKVSGTAKFEGQIKGWYYDDNYPSIQLEAGIQNASLKHESSPQEISGIELDANLQKPQGDLDQLVIAITKGQAIVGDHPVNLSLKLSHPISNPTFATRFQGILNLDALKNSLPELNASMSGQIDGNLELAGTMKAIEDKTYNKISSSGQLNFKQLSFKNKAMRYPFKVNSGKITIHPDQLVFSNFTGEIKENKVQLNGYLSNYLSYFIQPNAILKGNFNLNSNYLNCNELATLIEDEQPDSITGTKAPDAEILAFEIPKNLDLIIEAAVQKALFQEMTIHTISGKIIMKDGLLNLDHLKMRLLDGEFNLDGSYKGNAEMQPHVKLAIKVDSVEIAKAYQSFPVVRHYAPVARQSTGRISSDIQLNGQLDKHLKLINSRINGKATLSTKGLEFVQTATFNQVKDLLKKDQIKNLRVDRFSANLIIENGNIILSPFNTKIANQQTTINGHLSVDQQLDMNINFLINKNDVNPQITNMLGLLPGADRIQKYPIGVKIQGDLKKPSVSLDLSKARKEIQEQLKHSTQKDIENSVKKIGNKLRDLFK